MNKLLELVVQEGIFLDYRDLSDAPGKILGFYFIHNYTPYIILDQSLKDNPTLHKAILAEELGHHFAKVHSDFTKSDERLILRDEVAALRWAVKYLSADAS